MTLPFSHPSDGWNHGEGKGTLSQNACQLESPHVPSRARIGHQIPESELSSLTFHPFRTHKPQTSPSSWSWFESRPLRLEWEEVRKRSTLVHSRIPTRTSWDQVGFPYKLNSSVLVIHQIGRNVLQTGLAIWHRVLRVIEITETGRARLLCKTTKSICYHQRSDEFLVSSWPLTFHTVLLKGMLCLCLIRLPGL